MKVCRFQTFTCVLHSLVVSAQLPIAIVMHWNDIGIVNLSEIKFAVRYCSVVCQCHG